MKRPAEHQRLLDTALRHARRGFYIFPIRPDTKDRPAVPWREWSTNDIARVRLAWGQAFPGHNIGIDTGKSGLVVIDTDVPKGTRTEHGDVALKRLEQAYESLPPTPVVRTPRGGRHLFFTAGQWLVGNSNDDRIGPGVDVRGDGGYVVAAGSVVKGKHYEQLQNGEAPDLPPWLAQLAGSRPKGSAAITELEPSNDDDPLAQMLAQGVDEGGRDTWLTQVAGHLAPLVRNVEQLRALLATVNQQHCRPPLGQAPDDDADPIGRIAGSIWKAEAGKRPDLDELVTGDIPVRPREVQQLVRTAEAARLSRKIMDERAARERRLILGGMQLPVDVTTFITSGPDLSQACIWGDPAGVMLWASQQGTLIAGPPGTGKSTITCQLMLRRAGLITEPLLGFPVVPDFERRTLLFALDRAQQLRHSLARMLPSDTTIEQASRMQVIDNLPLELNLYEPTSWVKWLKDNEVGAIVIDSAKDLGFNLNEAGDGLAFNALMQATLRSGVEVVVCHHTRKTGRGDRDPLGLADVHGSQWITAGAGSVMLLEGKASNTKVRLHNVKALTAPMPTCSMLIDFNTGSVELGEDDEDESESKSTGRGRPKGPAAPALIDRRVTRALSESSTDTLALGFLVREVDLPRPDVEASIKRLVESGTVVETPVGVRLVERKTGNQ